MEKKESEKLVSLSNALFEVGLIDNVESFNGKFDCEGLPVSHCKVKWKSTNVLLMYLMNSLIYYRFILTGVGLAQGIATGFLNHKGEQIKPDGAKGARFGYGTNKNEKPRGHEKIDSVIQGLLDS